MLSRARVCVSCRALTVELEHVVAVGVSSRVDEVEQLDLVEAVGSGRGVSSRGGSRWESLGAIGSRKQRVFV